MRKTFLILSMVFILLFLTGCQESDEAKYKNAQSLMSKGQYAQAAAKFDELGSYEDATKLSMYCKAANAGENGEYDTAFSTFELLGDYKESTLMISYYKARQLESYESAEQWLNAAESFDRIQLFRDSKNRAESCREKVYKEAVDAVGIKNYEYAKALLRSLRAIEYKDSADYYKYVDALQSESEGKIQAASEQFSNLGDYKDAAEQTKKVFERAYNNANSLLKEGKTISAYKLFKEIESYKDVANLLSSNNDLINVQGTIQVLSEKYSVGKTVKFGNYKNEDIEWIVLKVQGSKALLFSSKILDIMAYDTSYGDIYWKDSSIRKWLTTEFFNSAFSSDEQSAVIPTSTDVTVLDTVFLLTSSEGKEYLNETNWKAEYTTYSSSLDDYKSDGNWWMRGTSKEDSSPATIGKYGAIDEVMWLFNYAKMGIRPALWFDLESSYAINLEMK